MIPTQSALRGYDTSHLTQHAAHWRDLAARRRSVVGGINSQAKSLDWEGQGGEGMKSAMQGHLSTAEDEAGLLESAAQTAEGGASVLHQQQESILSGVDQARQSGFAVGEDWSVTDTMYTPGSMGWYARQPTAHSIAADLRTQAGAFAGQESQTATDVTTAAGDLGGEGAVRGRIQEAGNGKDDDDDGKGRNTSKSLGKGAKEHVTVQGDPEHQWGHDTDPHERWPNNPGRTGTFDGGHGNWKWQGPGWKDSATAGQYSDGSTGQAGIDGWAAKGQTSWQRDVFGHPLTGSLSGEVGAHAEAQFAGTDHGVSERVGAFGGAEISGKVMYAHLGPVDLSLSGSPRFGVGADEGIDFGMQDGKLIIGGSAGLAWGPGGKIAPHIAIDTRAITGGLKKATDFVGGLFR